MRPTRSSRLFDLVLMLLVMFGIVTLRQPHTLTSSEAWWLWVVRDAAPVKFTLTAPGETARTVIGNFRTTLDRARQASLWNVPYAVALDVWSSLVGDSREMGRVFSAYMALLALAIVWRRLRVWGVLFIAIAVIAFFAAQQVGMLSLLLLLAVWLLALVNRRLTRPQTPLPHAKRAIFRAGVALILGFGYGAIFLSIISQPQPTWDAVVRRYLAARSPLEPVIFNYAPSSIAGYYDYRHNLRQGVSVNLSWKSFEAAEITTILDRLTQGGYPIWLVMPSDGGRSARGSAGASAQESREAFKLTDRLVRDLETRGWQRTDAYEADEMVFYRFEQVTISRKIDN